MLRKIEPGMANDCKLPPELREMEDKDETKLSENDVQRTKTCTYITT